MYEDDYARLVGESGVAGKPRSSYPLYRDGDEYKVVRHQI